MKIPTPGELVNVGTQALLGDLRRRYPNSTPDMGHDAFLRAVAEMIVYAIATSEALHHVEKIQAVAPLKEVAVP